MAEATSPGWARLRCETTCTLEYLHQITRELENTPWSCSWEILPDLDEHKLTEEIPEMDTEDPRPPSPPDRPTPPNPPDRPAKKEERADLELRAFRIQVEARKQRRTEARTGRIGSRQQLAGGVPWGCSGGAQRSYGDHLHPIRLRFHGKPLF